MRKALLLEILYVVLILLALFGIAFFQLLFILPGKIDTESIVFSLSLITVVVILLIYVRKLRKQLQQSTHEQSQRINPNHPTNEDAHAVEKQDVVTKEVHTRGINKKVKIATAVMLLSLLGLGMAYLIDSKIQDAYLQKIGEYSRYEQENKIDYATLEDQIQKLEKEHNNSRLIIDIASILLYIMIYLSVRAIFIAKKQEP